MLGQPDVHLAQGRDSHDGIQNAVRPSYSTEPGSTHRDSSEAQSDVHSEAFGGISLTRLLRPKTSSI